MSLIDPQMLGALASLIGSIATLIWSLRRAK
jgi:hypothetical protein